MRELSIDLETKSGADISKTGLYRYAQDPEFDILLLAYAWDDEPVSLVDLASGETIPEDVRKALVDPTIIKHAHNAAFEWYCINQYGIKTPLESWRCDMIHGMYCGYPGSLAALNEALGIPEDKRKLTTGKALIRFFCMPRKPTKTNPARWNLPKDNPEKWQQFCEYCKRDVATERENEKRLSKYPVPDEEWHLWHMDVAMNAFGVRLDTELIEGALRINDRSTEELTKEAKAVTGLDNPNSPMQMIQWCNDHGVPVTSLAKESVADALSGDLPQEARRALELRQLLGKTSIKKYQAMDVAKCDDGRVRGISQFYGANRTGRYAGRLIQLQNMTKNHIDTLDFARDLVRAGDYEAAQMFYGNVPDLLSQLIRTTLIPSEGNHFVVADFSAIEARVIAWLAGETWRIDLFKNGGDIYCESASKMFHIPVKKNGINGHLRQKGKVAELALGYRGGTGAMINMGALKMGLTEEELPDIVERWRAASPMIVKLWNDIESSIKKVMRTAQRVDLHHGISFALEGDIEYGQCFFTATLPTGRKLYYPKPHMADNRFGSQTMHYYTVLQQTRKWGVVDTHGGKMTENLVQAIARDCLTEVLLRVEKRGWQTVFHVHDELIVDAPALVTSDGLCEIMAEPIPWAPGLVLAGAGFESNYYMKD